MSSVSRFRDFNNSLLGEHLLRGLLKVRATLIVELLLSVCCTTLSLSILQGRLLISGRRLLHAHHGASVTRLASVALIGSQSCRTAIDAALLGHDRSHGSGLLLRLLRNNGKHAIFERLLVLAQPVLLPGEVKYLGVKIVALHALVKEADTELVVRVLLELQRATVLHIFFKLDRVAAAELVEGRLQLLFLDVLILLVLIFSWKVLPRQRAS